ncbi:MAG TPA: alanine racemase [Methylocystis sp.]|nr:alanine racemase [Methylocystis sp.]
MTIDLGALGRNWSVLSRRSQPGACSAVIKADGYGLGLEPVMRALLAQGCSTFFVATRCEGRRARAVSRDAAIYLLNGLAQDTPAGLKAFGLRPVLNRLAEIAEWTAAGGGPAALHIDTGMNRLGVPAKDAEAAAMLARGGALSLVMSHFACAERTQEVMNDRQIADFAALRARFPGVPASLANSSGIFLPQSPVLDLTRPGYAIYGGNPTPGQANPMQPVVRLAARILEIRHAAPGETVGYGAAWAAERATKLAVIGVGYADGLPVGAAAAPGKPPAEALVEGRRCPLVGRVSMDLSVLDVTDAPGAERGAWVEILGDEIGVDELAERAQTIGYEILTRLGQRYARAYVGG